MPSYDDTRHHEVARYFTATGHVMAPEVLVMSQRTWDRLTPADRDLVRTCADESVPYMRGLWDAREATSRAKVIAAGCQLIEDVDVEPFRALMAPVWERFVVTDLQKRLVRDIQAME
jgi:TRAP-type C4-dicarboxylate transport system substrate-binding protein